MRKIYFTVTLLCGMSAIQGTAFGQDQQGCGLNGKVCTKMECSGAPDKTQCNRYHSERDLRYSPKYTAYFQPLVEEANICAAHKKPSARCEWNEKDSACEARCGYLEWVGDLPDISEMSPADEFSASTTDTDLDQSPASSESDETILPRGGVDEANNAMADADQASTAKISG